MLGLTYTLRKIAAGVALALSVAALIVPQALAGGGSPYGAPDGWYPHIVSLSRARDVARYGAPDGWYPYVLSLARAHRGPAGAPAAVVTVVRSPGFAWRDFGIGIAAAVGAMLLLAGSIFLLTGRHGRKQPDSVAAV